jgi:ATP-binding cassette subfamily B protein RaxB
MTIDAKFTVGMIFAFQAYKSQFLGSSMRLAGQWVQWRLLDVHLSRIADIALAPAETDSDSSFALLKSPLRGAIEVRNLSFSYGRGEGEILRRVNLAIEPGETVALVGPSGGGKTTLMKLILGFYAANSGEILIDGEPLSQFGLQRFRTQAGAVLQEDVLYAGTLAENIGFFDPELDLNRVKEVAQLACIDDEIMSMTMGYESLVGDMGSSLSGGQKQRILLARALYNRPKVLFMDEGTAHLDLRTEAEVNASIAELGITRLIIAHRPETIRMADRVMLMSKGVLKEITSSVRVPDA